VYTLTDDTCKEFIDPKIFERSRMTQSPNIVFNVRDEHGKLISQRSGTTNGAIKIEEQSSNEQGLGLKLP